MSTKDLGEWIQTEIKKYMAGPENSMEKWEDEPAWAEPLIGFSSGADPLYKFYKKDIGDFYILPHEFMRHKYGREYDPSQLTVIS